jgi:hypothetical protein
MLRSIIIGFAVAALLQVGVRTASPAPDLAAVAQNLNWAQLQCDGAAFVRLVVDGYATLTR